MFTVEADEEEQLSRIRHRRDGGSRLTTPGGCDLVSAHVEPAKVTGRTGLSRESSSATMFATSYSLLPGQQGLGISHGGGQVREQGLGIPQWEVGEGVGRTYLSGSGRGVGVRMWMLWGFFLGSA